MLLNMITWIVTTSLLSYSIWRIRKFSAVLAQNKIFANEKLMLIHLISFFVITIVSITIDILVLAGNMYEAIDNPYTVTEI